MSLIRVALDAQIFQFQERGGISRVFLELERVSRDAKSTGVAYLQTARMVRSEVLLRRPNYRALRVPNHGMRLATLVNTVSMASARADLIHSTYYDGSFLRVDSRLPHIVTVHDMIPEDFPDLFPGGNPHAQKRAFCDAASLITCDSEFSRHRVLAHWPHLEGKLRVVHLGASIVGELDGALGSVGIAAQGQYLLYVGARQAHKNFAVLPGAVSRAAAQMTDLRVLVVGGGPWTSDELALLAEHNVSARFERVDATDAELGELYRNAFATVVTSVSEGFGLPVLEALAAGCPVVAADAGSLPEVGGGVCHYFQPADPEGLAGAIVSIPVSGTVRMST